jgi:hypothetical protein
VAGRDSAVAATMQSPLTAIPSLMIADLLNAKKRHRNGSMYIIVFAFQYPIRKLTLSKKISPCRLFGEAPIVIAHEVQHYCHDVGEQNEGGPEPVPTLPGACVSLHCDC